MDQNVVAALIAAVPATLAAVLSYRAVVGGRHNAKRLDEAGAQLDRVEKQTNGELDRKIERAVRAVLVEDPSSVTGAVVAEAVRDLLDGILEAAADNSNGTS